MLGSKVGLLGSSADSALERDSGMDVEACVDSELGEGAELLLLSTPWQVSLMSWWWTLLETQGMIC